MAGSSGGGSRGLISRVRLVHLCRQGDRTRRTARLVCHVGPLTSVFAGQGLFFVDSGPRLEPVPYGSIPGFTATYVAMKVAMARGSASLLDPALHLRQDAAVLGL